MGRRTHLLLYIFTAVVCGWNVYMNWSIYNRGRLPGLAQSHIFNMILMSLLVLVSLGRILKLLTAPKPERILDPHATVVIAESLIVRLVRMLMLSIFIAAGVWGLVSDSAPLGGIRELPLVYLLLLGIGVYGLAGLVFNPRLQLTLTPQSLAHSRLRPAVIAWEDLAGITSRKILMSTAVTLVLRETREFRPASLLARWRGVDKIQVNPMTFGVDPDVLRQGIELRRNVFTF
jgi:hypothetical protein